MIKPEIVEFFDSRSIATRVRALGHQLEKERAVDDPLVISLLGGSVVFMADLLRNIDAPLRFEFIHVGYASHDGEEQLDIHYPIPIDVTGQSLLLIKDVVSSAIIETYLVNQFLDHGAASVELAALIDLPKERKTHFDVDYSLFTTERSGRLVGYGMKHEGRYGTLPYIGYLVDQGSEES